MGEIGKIKEERRLKKTRVKWPYNFDTNKTLIFGYHVVSWNSSVVAEIGRR